MNFSPWGYTTPVVIPTFLCQNYNNFNTLLLDFKHHCMIFNTLCFFYILLLRLENSNEN